MYCLLLLFAVNILDIYPYVVNNIQTYLVPKSDEGGLYERVIVDAVLALIKTL